MNVTAKRSRLHAVVTALTVMTVLIMTIVAVFDMGSKTAEIRLLHQAEQLGRAQTADQQISERCRGMGAPALVTCVRQIVEDQEVGTLAQQDLAAQREMALWAKWMTIASGLGIALTAGGIYYVRKTLVANYEAMAIARDIGQSETRAYLACTESIYGVGQDGMIALIKVLNNGKSPAFRVQVHARLYVSVYGLIVSKISTASCEVIQAGQEGEAFLFFASEDLDGVGWQEIAKDVSFFLKCRVKWLDVFGNPLMTDHILSKRPDRGDEELFSFLSHRGKVHSMGVDLEEDWLKME